jgi:hypothetical protein
MTAYTENMNWKTEMPDFKKIETWTRDLAGYNVRDFASEGKSGSIFSYWTGSANTLNRGPVATTAYRNEILSGSSGTRESWEWGFTTSPQITYSMRGIDTVVDSFDSYVSANRTTMSQTGPIGPTGAQTWVPITTVLPQTPQKYHTTTQTTTDTNTGITTAYTETWNTNNVGVITGQAVTIITDPQNPTNTDTLTIYYSCNTPGDKVTLRKLRSRTSDIDEYKKENQNTSPNNTASVIRSTSRGYSTAGNLISKGLSLVEKQIDANGTVTVDLTRSTSASVDAATNTATGSASIVDNSSTATPHINYSRTFTVKDSLVAGQKYKREVTLDIKNGTLAGTVSYNQVMDNTNPTSPVWVSGEIGGPWNGNQVSYGFTLQMTNAAWQRNVANQMIRAARDWLASYGQNQATEQAYFTSAAFSDPPYKAFLTRISGIPSPTGPYPTPNF